MFQRYCSESNIAHVSPVVGGASRWESSARHYCVWETVRPTLDWRQVVHALFTALCLSFAAPVMAYLVINRDLLNENDRVMFGAKAESAGIFRGLPNSGVLCEKRIYHVI